MAMASDIAFYVGPWNPGWYDATQADHVATIIAESGHLFKDVQQFDDTQFGDFTTWIEANTDDGEMDIIWLNGTTPSVLYQFPNVNPDGSPAETWLDNGNMIINVGDWFGYMSYEGGARSADNAGAGAANILDLDASIIAGGPQGTMDITPDGQAYIPSMTAVASDRPVLLSAVVAPWEVAATFGQNAAGTYADPIVIHNTETDGYLAIVNQNAGGGWFPDRGLACAEFINNWVATVVGLGDPSQARDPNPDDGVSDVPRDGDLSWFSGMYPSTHNVYFGETYEDVNRATAPDASGDATLFDPGRLEFGKTYYWRVDEVNTSPDKTVHKGKIWSFEVEPYAIPVPIDVNNATASSSAPKNPTGLSVDGSGLTGMAHSTDSATMWLSGPADFAPWLMYEFDRIEKLDKMLVWNSNSSSEGFIGWGLKDVSIEYSTDGVDWTVLAGTTQLDRAPGTPTYNTPQVVDFGSVPAKYVKLNIQSNWGGLLPQYGVSEVQFFGVPVYVRSPIPASGSVDIRPDAVTTWRAGREASQHTVYVSDDANAVADGSATSISSMTNSADLSAFDLQMSGTYYWRVDEVNDAMDPSVWSGPVWSLDTATSLVVDDFESYGNKSPDRPFQTWLDGYGYSADEFFPVDYPGNGTGSGIGHDVWSPSSPYFNGSIMETTNTIAGSSQSMPFYYSNTGGVASKTTRTFAVPQDWTVGGAKTLSIAFNGQSGNTGILYVMINNAKVTYQRDNGNISRGIWQAWNIDLASISTNLQSITTLEFGVEGSGASGMILIDDIRLYAEAGELITPADPGTNGLVAEYTFENNASDVSGNGNNGTLNGDPIFSAGVVGSALDCDGVDDFMSTTKTASALGIGGNSPRTISSWVYTKDFANGGIYDVGDRVTGEDFSLRTLDSVENRWRIQYWGGDYDFTFDTVNKWVNFVHVHDGTHTKIYANGVLIVDWEKTLNTTDTNMFQIGRYGWPDAYFYGLIDEVRVYNRALSAGEALWLAGITNPIDKPF
ncbi:MAG: discoidin domain-containing protein [Phycisphaerae bacterium]|nr:discoidin domain-containing protein [Phycisphaerae bacterium]